MPKSAKPKATPAAKRAPTGRRRRVARVVPVRKKVAAKRPLRVRSRTGFRIAPKVRAAGKAEKPARRTRKARAGRAVVAVTAPPPAEVRPDAGRAVGRPTKLTPEVWDAICLGVEKGMSPSRSAIHTGVSPKTLSDWRAENDDFSQAIDQARSRGIAKRIETIDGAIHSDGRKDWKAQAWLLGKMAPDEFGEKVQHEHGGTLTLQVPAEHLRRIQARRREQLAKLASKTAK